MDKSLLNNFKPCVMNVGGIENNLVKVEGYGSITILLKFKNQELKLTLLKIYWGPSLEKNIISGRDKHGHWLKIKNSCCQLYSPNNQLIAVATLEKNLYILHSRIAKEACINISVDTEENQPKERQDIMMWHRRFGHQNVESLKHMNNQKLVYGIYLQGKQKQCDI
ncbi:hypothetical protein AVEN_20209-1 [Araneus ventricosus]|uniref:GAG-pre-integrase domain-containing protein n=1 Tax=Araneus ventricosus TaxID=182803 RepID=A0A4Y2CKT1_ARAVE|nr:hypothetical protein AVEN_20209-1 [Araneus ventricosus]